MKKVITGMIVLALALTAGLSATPSLAQATTTTTHINRTLTDVRPNPCNGEPVLLEAKLKLTIHRTINDDGSTHLHITSNIHGTGLGLDSGAKYRLNSVATSSTNVVGATTQTLWQDAVLVAQGDVPNFLFQQTEHITINANGEVTTVFDHAFTKCQG